MKMSAWEPSFDKRIRSVRQREMTELQHAHRLKAINEGIFFCCNIVITTFVLVIHVTQYNGELSPGSVFSTISLFSLVQFTMGKFFGFGVMSSSECFISIKRLYKFFCTPELERTIFSTNPELEAEGQMLNFSNVTCHWNDDWKEETNDLTENVADSSNGELCVALNDISFNFRSDELLCVIGSVGCGKSALLMAIAGELPTSSGKVLRNFSSMAYAAQDPWIMDGSVRENVVMGRPFDKVWYTKVIKACGLDVDLERFRSGDMTIVGDKGVQCSGGQRARIGLARALYVDADLLLLDDPLSAVDARVGRLIYNAAIIDLRIKRKKGVILVTHQHQFLGNSRCLYLHDGALKYDGSYESCIEESGGMLSAAIQDESSEGKVEDSNEVEEENINEIEEGDKDGVETFKEKSASGIVTRETFIGYIRAMGGFSVATFFFFLFASAQASSLFSIRSFGEWSEKSEPDELQEYGPVLIYCFVTVILSFSMACFSIFFMLRASQNLHDDMTKSVLRAKISFFDTNPLGRILNRFSADTGITDDLLPTTLYDFLVCSFFVMGGVSTAIIVLPLSLLAIPLLVWYFMQLRETFLLTSRETKRLEGVARSPIFSMLSESITGISTIRSCDYSKYFLRKFEDAHDSHTRAFFAFIAASRWLGFRLDFIMATFLAITCYLAVFVQYYGLFDIDSSTLGLALLMLIQLSGTFQWCVRQSAEVVNHMVSTERMLAFTKVESEAALETSADSKHIEKWPTSGSINFQHVSARYRDILPKTLDDVSFEVRGGDRIGVVGRTGSGKSTLIQTLFRILEAESGTIKVDGVDIKELGLHLLRKKMSVIPQYPVLFAGCTVRENLDPFDSCTETQILESLADVQMHDSIMSLPAKLDTRVAEGGSNFSVGQRQLLCLARAILRHNKLLILDEPTANVDNRTDELLQEAVAKSFKGSTIISVAHRLDTVIDYDKILVLGNGKVLEYGSPSDLLMKDGHFASMVNDTGEGMAKQLRLKALSSANKSK